MEAAVEALGRELGKLRTGRATPGMLDHVVVSAYGSLTPLNRVATVSLADAQTLAVTLYDPGPPAQLTPLGRVSRSDALLRTAAGQLGSPSLTVLAGSGPLQLLHEVEKGIMDSPMGLNPAQGAGGSLTVNADEGNPSGLCMTAELASLRRWRCFIVGALRLTGKASGYQSP
eukprot:SM000019S04967  [mRNA]  locus=s19:233423:234499:- [translate_table: standard]